MNSFKLNMEKARFNKRRESSGVLMYKAFKLVKTGIQFHDRWGYEQCVAGSGPSNPILSSAEFARVLGFPASASQQPRSRISRSDNGSSASRSNPIHHRVDVVRHLSNVVDWLTSLCFGLEAE